MAINFAREECAKENCVTNHLLSRIHVQIRAYNGSALLKGKNEMHVPEAKDWRFDVDKYLNPYIPRNLVYRLPKPLSHFLGHRDRPRTGIGNIIVAGWALLGAFVGVAVIEAAFMAPSIKDHGVPLLIGSFVRFELRIAGRVHADMHRVLQQFYTLTASRHPSPSLGTL